jgi:hypothetical protein
LAAMASTYRFYNVHRLHAMYEAYPEIRALAENPMTAAGLAGVNRDRPTPEQARLSRQRGHHADLTLWADVDADLQRGAEHLTSGGVGVAALYAQMQGIDLVDFARHRGKPEDEVRHHHDRAMAKIAHFLEPRLEPLATASGAA